MALRFHGEETDVLPREKLLESMRLALDHREFADQVIPDLTRWEDWEVMPRLVKMFKESPKDDWIRQPVVSYLLVAAEEPGDVGERAKAALAELEGARPGDGRSGPAASRRSASWRGRRRRRPRLPATDGDADGTGSTAADGVDARRRAPVATDPPSPACPRRRGDERASAEAATRPKPTRSPTLARRRSRRDSAGRRRDARPAE